MKALRLTLFISLLAGSFLWPATAATNIYHQSWIDLNKNGQKDPYEDPTLDVEKRLDDLIARMTVEEKTCQMATLYGYGRVLKDDLPTPDWKNQIWKDGIANIDEHLNGFRGWNKTPSDNANCWPASAHVKALNAVQRFFIEETRLGIPAEFTDEGIRGVESFKATCFPTQLGIGCTWNRQLVRQIGEITGKEARALGYHNVYAPILDVIRDQRWGRCEESYGEDPFLAAQLGTEMVRAMQAQHIVSTPKHFAIYSSPKGGREGFARTDPHESPREVEEIFLPSFRAAFAAGALGVMSSYNDYDGVPVTGSDYWLTKRLRDGFGFKGYVVSDSDAVEYLHTKHHVAGTYKEAVRQAVMAGLNVRTTFTPPDVYINPLRELIKEGALPMAVIDSRVRDVLRVKFWEGTFDHPYIDQPEESDKIVCSADHQKVALQASRECLVLLKNDKNLLPLSHDLKRIAVCGPNANETSYALLHYGPLAVKVTTVLAGIKAKVGPQTEVVYTKGCEIVDENWPDSELFPETFTSTERAEMELAVTQAKSADVAIVVLGDSTRTCGENKSRTSLSLPGRQQNLLKAVQATGKPTILVIISGRPISVNWPNRYCPAILQAFYPGSEGGMAIAEALFGDYNPGGKLTVTVPKTVGQIPLNFPAKPAANFEQADRSASTKGLAGVQGPLYPFGYGLSYTTFEFRNLKINPLQQQPSGNITITCEIKNTGSRPGDEVVQLYTTDLVSSVTTYEKNLRGFERIHLKPGESQPVTFTLKPEHLQLINRDWKRVVEPGEFRISIGSSSEDIRLTGKFEILPATTN
jgi:beta-glucosidase